MATSPNPPSPKGATPSGGRTSGGGGGQNRSRNRRRGSGGGSGGSRQQGGRSQSNRGGRPPERSPRPAARPVPLAVSTAPLTGRAAVTPPAGAPHPQRAVWLAASSGVAPGLIVGIVVGLLTSLLAGLVAAVVVLVAVALAVWRGAPKVALGMVGARVVDEDEEPQLVTLVEGLCATFGLRVPAVAVVEDPVPNACAFGHDPSHATLVFTTGLLDRLGLIELEGVVAHELVHVKRHDTVVSSMAVATLRPVARLTGSDTWLHRALGHGREYRADQLAVAAVRYPPGLHDALAALSDPPAVVEPASVFSPRKLASTRWVWLDPMAEAPSGSAPDGELDAASVRLAALAEY